MQKFFKEWRIWSGISQQDLAEKMEVTRQRVWRIETGKADFDGKYLVIFAQATGCPHPAYPILMPPAAPISYPQGSVEITTKAAEIHHVLEASHKRPKKK